MKKVDGFVLRQLGEEYIIVGEGVEQINFNKLISLNKSAKYLWENAEGEFDINLLRDLLLKKYDVSSDLAYADASSLVEKWIEVGIIEM